MTNIFKESLALMNETLNKMYLKEDEDKFISVAEQKDNFDETNPSANIYQNETELDTDKQQEKHELTSQVIEKIKQSLKVSDELQSILNRIKKINDNVDTNEWKVNEENNTAVLRNKNAYIFKQNDNLCLSHNGKIEIFKSVQELHDWLKKNNYPLPHNISLHESVLNETNINRTEGWQEIKDLTDQNEKLQQQLNISGQELKAFTNKINTLMKRIEKANAAISGTSDIIAFVPWPEMIVQKIGRELHPGEENKILERKKEAEIEYIEALDELKELINKNSGYESIEQLKSDKNEAFKVLNKYMNFCGEILKNDPTNKDALKALDNHTKYLIKNYYDNFALPTEKKNFEYEQIKKQIEDNKQKILEIYKKYNAEPGTWDPDYQDKKINIEKPDYSKQEKHIWDDDSEEEINTLKTKDFDINSREFDLNDDIEALRFKNRYDNTAWAPILKHRWENLGNTQSWTPEEIEAHKKEYVSHMNPNARGMGWAQEKDARKRNDIHLVKNEYKPKGLEDIAPKTVYNDLQAGKNVWNLDKKESTEDNQITDNEIWYLEYQTNIPNKKLYLNNNWNNEDLLSDNLKNAAKFISYEDAIKELKNLYISKRTEFPFKPISGLSMNECGVTVGGSLGSAVQYLGNKKEESLTEAERDNVKSRSSLNTELVNTANIKNSKGEVIGKPGKTVENYAIHDLLGFSYNEAGSPTLTINGHTYRLADNLLRKRVALDFNTEKPIGIIHSSGKVYGLNGLQIGYADTREAALNKGIDLDKLAIDSKSTDNWQYTQKAGAQWCGNANKLGFYNIKTGLIRPKYQNVWDSEPYSNNPNLYNNPEILATMFTGYLNASPEILQARINEINNVFDLKLIPDESLQPTIMNKQRGNNYQEFIKWRDTYYAPLFKQSRLNDKESDKINKDAEGYKTQREEWIKSMNDRIDAEKSIQPIVDKMMNINQDFMDAKVDGETVDKAFEEIVNNEAIPLNIKTKLANNTYEALKTYDNTTANFFKRAYSKFFNQNESTSFKDYLLNILTEADSPADFADGSANIASDMSSTTTGTNVNTNLNTEPVEDISQDIDGYGPEDSMSGGNPSFGDINIGGGIGGASEEIPMTQPENKKIIDVLVNESDLSQIKVKVKNLDNNKIEIKNLDEINI